MEIKKLTAQTKKKCLKLITLSSFLLLGSCTTDETLSDSELNSTSLNVLSSNSVELSVSSTTADEEQSENPASNATDTDGDSRWSGFGDPVNLDLDLGSVNLIDYVNIAYHNGDERTNSFQAYTSTNNSDWTLVGTKNSSGSTESLETFDLSNTEGRYLRLTCTGNSDNNWNSILDIQVYGKEGDGGGTPTSTYVSVPSKIEAEDFDAASEGRTETNGSITNVGWIDSGESTSYNINVNSSGIYDIDFRVASRSNGSEFDIYQGSSKIGSVSSNSTGGWYTWETVTATVNLSSGDQTLQIVATGSGWNFDWLQVKDSDDEETPTTTPPSGSTPYDILGSVISDFKITYPVAENGNDSSDADDCDERNNDAHEQRDLTGSISSTYSDYFYVSGDEVVFKAHVGGATTENSNYPRSEFRQLVGGDDNYWSMEDYQYLEVRVRATHLPDEKPEVSMVQVHGPEDEPLRIEYNADSQGLHVVKNESNTETYVLDYELGQSLFITVTVNNGDISVTILNEATGEDWDDTWTTEDSTGYFKVGCYTQSSNNLETCKPGEGWDNQDPDEYGEVRIKDLKLTETY